jgi:hypothetical protein
VYVGKIRMEQNVAGCPSSFMDKGQHWLQDLLRAMQKNVLH